MTARTKVASWAGLMLMLWAPVALAQEAECAADADCDAGFVCEVVSAGTCPAIACAPGETCDLPACESTETMGCVPGPCDTDADCGDNQICYKETVRSCSGSSGGGSEPCPSDGECPVPASEPLPPEESCTDEEYSQCIPRRMAPCEEAADCGPGFTCEALESCSVSGGSSTDAACPPGAECPAPEPVCEPTGMNYCKLVETPCVEDSECGAGLVCADAGGNTGVACGGTDPGSAGGAGSGADPLPADGGAPDENTGCEPVEAEPNLLCVPAGYEVWGVTAYDLASGEATASLGGIEEDGSAGGDPRADNGGETPQDPAGEFDGDDSSSEPKAEAGGCSVSSTRAATSQGLWLLLAAAFLVRRRRG